MTPEPETSYCEQYSPLETFYCEQYSPEYWEVRRGIVTASKFSDVLATGRGGGESATRRKYLYTLAGEIITGQVADTWAGNRHTERGHLLEDEARQSYALITGEEPTLVGFMRRGRIGCSPDSLIGDDGLLEIKTKLPHLQIDLLERDRVPPEHEAQIQGQMLVSGREWCDFVSYWPGLPLFIRRVQADADYQASLQAELDKFIAEINRVVEKYQVTP